MTELNKDIEVFAPATTSNLAVGFDIMGFPLTGLGDTVRICPNSSGQLHIVAIEKGPDIPLAVDENTVTVAMQAVLNQLKSQQGFDVWIEKGIPLGSGLGGSAASSVAGAYAVQQFFDAPLPTETLLHCALEGEKVATGSLHGDNVVPCLLGGWQLIHSLAPFQAIRLPKPSLWAAFVHPHMTIKTRDARAALKEELSFKQFVRQNTHTASFIAALYEKDYALLQSSGKDEVVEEMRAHLIPGFYAVKSTALSAGALMCSISGAGPTVFALAHTKETAMQVSVAMQTAFKQQQLSSDVWLSEVEEQGVRRVDNARP